MCIYGFRRDSVIIVFIVCVIILKIFKNCKVLLLFYNGWNY